MTLSANVSNTTSCVFSVTPALTGLPATVSCTSGAGSVHVTVPANALATPKTYAFELSAVGTKTVKAPAAVTVAGTSGPVPVLDVSGTLTGNNTWSPQIATAYVLVATVDVPVGITLTVQPGTVIKSGGPSLTIEGTLDAVGTSAAPIVFTSINDNSVGGVTGSGSPAAGDWGGIEVSGAGSVDFDHTQVEYATEGLSGTTTGSVTVTNGQWDQFTQGGLMVSAGPVTVENTAVLNDGYFPAFWVGSNELNLDTLGGNSASGGVPSFFVTGTVSATSTWQAEPASWLLSGCGNPGLTISAGVTVTVAVGTVIKGGQTDYAGCSSNGSTPYVGVEGTLDAVGTSAAPIVFTSINDNSVGGVTGSGSPAAGDWGGIEVSGAGSVDLEDTTIAYAATALVVAAAGSDANLSGVTIESTLGALNVLQGSVAFRGTLENVGNGIQACDWSSSACSVDAAYSYWGSSDGPFPGGHAPLACGAVTVSPWYTTLALTTTNSGTDVFGVGNCDGSSSPESQLNTASQNYSNAIAQEGIQCGDGFEDACQAIQQAQACLSGADSVAESQSPFPLSTPDDAVGTLGDALSTAENTLVSTFGEVLSFAVDIKGVGTTVVALANAYNSCAP